MKKVILIVCIFIMNLLCSLNASAAKVGEVVNNTVYTDIIASINDYNILSHNIDGYTVIVAEDLIYYGFNVDWKEKERAIYVSRNKGVNNISSTYIAPENSKDIVGNKGLDVLYSDIKAYVNGKLVTSYNIGGRTMIYFDDLSAFG